MRRGTAVGLAFVILLAALPGVLGEHLAPGEEESCYEPPESEVADARGHGRVCVDVVSFDLYDPAVLVVDAGTEVVWYNEGSLAHTVTFVLSSTGESFDAFVPAGEHTVYTFEEAGTFYYDCTINALHMATMHGKVVVE